MYINKITGDFDEEENNDYEDEEDEEEWIDWNKILDDESKTSLKIEKAFKRK